MKIKLFLLFFWTNFLFASNLIIPGYFYEQQIWDRVLKLKNNIVIVNPNNGPGNFSNSHYRQIIKKLKFNNNIPIGYIYTKWSKRNLNKVKNDIKTWINLYPDIQGFFVDEVSTKLQDLKCYKNLYLFIKSLNKNYKIILNPGTEIPYEYYEYADIIVVLENKFSSKTKIVDNICQNKKNAVILYNVKTKNSFNYLNNKLKKCNYIYLTEDNLPNPFNSFSFFY